MLTPKDLAAQIRKDVKLVDAIQLACGVVMPSINVQTGEVGSASTIVNIGNARSGSVKLSLWWSPEGLTGATLHSFFYSHHKNPDYEAALLKQSGGRPMTHVFMLLIDEVVYWIMKANPDEPECVIKLLDAARLLDPSPCALLGRTPFYVQRDSRYLEWVRGSAYYVTFGFWPTGEEPEHYLARVAEFAHPGTVGAVQGDPQYEAMLEVARRPGTSEGLEAKQMPPVLLAADGLRRFADMDDYFARVLVPGEYGRTPCRAPPPMQPTPYERPVEPQQRALVSDRSVDDIVAALRADAYELPGGVYDGVPADLVELWSHGSAYRVELGRWEIALRNAVATVEGPLERVTEVAALAERLGARLFGEPVTVEWKLPLAPLRTVVVTGQIVTERSDARFRPPGAARLAAAGLAPLDVEPADLPQLLQEADRCDQLTRGRLIGQRHPQFAACRRVAQRMKNTWVSRKRPREEGTPAEDGP